MLWFTRNIRLSHGFFLNHQTSWSLLGLHWGPFLTTVGWEQESHHLSALAVKPFICVGEVGWVEINKECLCQYLREQSSWHLAVIWGGEIWASLGLRFSCFPWSCAPLLLLWKLTGPSSGLIFPSPTILPSSPLYLPIDFNRIQMLVPPTQPFIVSKYPRTTWEVKSAHERLCSHTCRC